MANTLKHFDYLIPMKHNNILPLKYALLRLYIKKIIRNNCLAVTYDANYTVYLLWEFFKKLDC